jgi:two-component system sensor histidine kinase MprB
MTRTGFRRLTPRTLRTRLALLTALAAFGSLTLAGIVVSVATARTLGQGAESQIRQLAEFLPPPSVPTTPELLSVICDRVNSGGPLPAEAGELQAADGFLRSGMIITVKGPNGAGCRLVGGSDIHHVAPAAWGWRRLLGSDLPHGRGDRGEELLVLQRPVADGWDVLLARDISREIAVVHKLRGVMTALSVVGGLVALGFGLLIARGGLRPVAALAETAETIARTQDLSVRVDVPDRDDSDEVTRLARAFDRMTSALAASRDRQAQLVADAGHELRTPLTSLRTNIDLLLRAERSGRALPSAQRDALFEDVRSQLAELSQLAGELTVLAHDEPAAHLVSVRLDEVLAGAVRRIGPRAGERTLDQVTEPWRVDDADPAALQRALVNVLDNAVKFSPPTSTVRIRLAGGVLTVDDEGPGVAADRRAEAFARFWRGDAARALPGSGLGLSIVADTVARHGGTVELTDAPGGGARVRLLIPGRPDRSDPADHPHSLGTTGVGER